MRWGGSNSLGKGLVRWALGFTIWTVLGLCEATQSYFSYAAGGDPLRWSQALAMGMFLWYAWGPLWLVALYLARRFPLEEKNWPAGLAFLLAGAGLALAKLALDYPIIKTCYCPRPDKLTFAVFYRAALTGHFFPYAVIGWSMLGVGQALNYYEKYREHALRAAQLETSLARAQLQLLKAQLRPHFLFNTLNSISALLHTDAEGADRMVARLGDLLRLSLDNFGVQEVSLGRELHFVETYLEIEQVRFGPRLSVRLAVEPGALGALVPYLLLQPLVENAIRHGIGPRPGPGRLTVRARRAGAALRLEVEDDGAGLSADFTEGVGLRNTRARLRELYGDEQSLRLTRGSAGGVCVTVDLPFRPSDEGWKPGRNGQTPTEAGEYHGAHPHTDR